MSLEAMAKPQIRAMVFDADGVLVRPKTWFLEPAERVYGVPKAEFMAFIHGEFKRCCTGELELLDVLPVYLERWGVSISAQEFVQTWIEHEHHVDQALLERIQAIRQAGTPCYLGTNQERNRANYMKREMGLEAALDGVFASSDLGARKPDRAFYERVQTALGLEPQAILFWDDSSANVEAARAVGWQAELFTTFEVFEKRLTDKYQR
jgi:putative hydrolase of the HAD superfamily